MKKIFSAIAMRILSASLITCAIMSTTARAQNTEPKFTGRWDITIDAGNNKWPSWLEVTHSGLKTLVGHFVGVSGSARPISEIEYTNGQFSFSIPPQWEEGSDLKVEGKFEGGKLSGTMVMPDGKSFPFTGVRAPTLRGGTEVTWGTPIKLFNGQNLDGWKTTGGENQWVAENGVLKSPKSGANIYTTRTFKDFKLHIEFRYPKGSNSGVYLRGRYEVQIMDSKGSEPSKGEFGAVYGFIIPSEMAAGNAGEWQTYDITLVGRMVTIVANGKMIVCNQEIPGITGGALDSNEGEPGPIFIQGDHGAIEYRNIELTPAK